MEGKNWSSSAVLGGVGGDGLAVTREDLLLVALAWWEASEVGNVVDLAVAVG